MNQSEKERQAIRIMEALSDVNQELLERSENAGASSERGNKMLMFVKRYGGLCAACIVGIVLFAAYQNQDIFRNKSTGMKDNAAEMIMMDSNNVQEEQAENTEELLVGQMSNQLSYPAEPEWMQTLQGGSVQTVKITEAEKSVPQLSAKEDIETNIQDKEQKFVAGDGGSLALQLPERYQLIDCDEESGACLYSDGNANFWIRILNADGSMIQDENICIIQNEKTTEEQLPSTDAIGYTGFAFYDESKDDSKKLYVYFGNLSLEELYAIFPCLP